MNYRLIYFLCGTAVLFLAACDNTKYLAPGQDLYVGAKLNVKAEPPISKKKKKALESDMKSLIRPKPNSTILGIRLKLTFYNMVDTPKGKGLRYLIKNKLGEPPVIASYNTLLADRAVIQNRLENRGFFKDTVTLDSSVHHRKFTGVFTAYVNNQYTIRNISFPSDSSVLSRNIRGRDATQKRAIKRSLFKEGAPYDLDVIKAERARIDARLKNRGFYYFSPDYLIASADSTVGAHKVDIAMQVKDVTPPAARRQYRINDVVVYADYDINSDTSTAGAKNYKGYTIVDPNHRFNPKMFTRMLVFDTGELYNREDHNLSLNRLTTLGVYKFVKARFLPAPNSDSLLNAYYYLTPTDKKSLRLQVSGITKSNSATGGEVSVSWRHRSLFKGAELFTITASGGIEQQVSGGVNVSTRRGGLEANLYVPRIIAPFHFRTNSSYVPHTKFTLGYDLFNRNTQYLLTSYRGSYGYVWKENILSEHQLNIININSVQPAHITADFADSLKLPKFIPLARSIEKQFIIGSNYNYNFNTANKVNRHKNEYYFNGNLDVSGNLLGLATGANRQQGKVKEIFKTPFSQYTRVELEFRHTYKLGTFSSINSRLLGGVAYAYGNSNQVPFIKEFFAGGTSDIRAFRSRTLGPGSYYAGNGRDSFVVEQPGDIKLELNAEYRAKLFSIVRGALFVDAGNVWTRNEDTAGKRAGTKFTGQFAKQIAVGMGAGLRFDINILVLRVDVAIPVRVPYLPDGQRWVFDQIDFGSSTWRRNNLIFNLAIGYPF